MTRLQQGIALLVLAASVVAAGMTVVEGNPASRLASIEALADHGEWRIDHSIYLYRTVDKVYLGGAFYSSKPPLYAAVGAVVYGIVRGLTSLRFATDERTVVIALRLLLQIAPFALGLVVAGRLLRRHVAHEGVRLVGFAGFAAGTLIFGYSATINPHSLAALLILAAFAEAVPHPEGSVARTTASWMGMGLAAASAVTLDFGAGAFAVSLAGYLILSQRGPRLAWFFVGAAVPVAVHLALTYKLTGSLLPFYGEADLYSYPGSYWGDPKDFDALDEPKWIYAFHALIGHHGLFAMTPLFLFAIPGTIAMLRSRQERGAGAFIAVVVTITLFVYVFLGPSNYGGTCTGMRWFIVLAPLLWFAAVRRADSRWHSGWHRVLFVVATAVSIAHACYALTGPWRVSPWHHFIRWLGLGSVTGDFTYAE